MRSLEKPRVIQAVVEELSDRATRQSSRDPFHRGDKEEAPVTLDDNASWFLSGRPRRRTKSLSRKKNPSDRYGPPLAFIRQPSRPRRLGRAAGRARRRHRREGPDLLARTTEDAQARPRRRADGGHGPHAWAVRRRIHHQLRRRLRDAAVGDGSFGRGGRPGISNEDARDAQANGPARDGRGLVPLSPGLRVLDVRRRHQHAAVLRGSESTRRRGRRGPRAIGQGKSRHRLLPAH
mmetsp:Transcript_25548/g.101830  ORF Transcript_25548/g.101830 Transcript_25548/m.101830 type:complete len:235 (-) Transcript_25548:1373-2077(-)